MALKKYLCTHCGKRFEAEEREIVECPGCFWSTSVKPDSGGPSAVKTSSAAAKPQTAVKMPSLNLPQVSFKPEKLLKPLILAAVIALIFFLGISVIRSGMFSKNKKTDIPAVIDAEESGKSSGGGAGATQGTAAGAALTADEQASLSRRAVMEESSEPSPEMAGLLSREASFQSGSVQRLPSKSWTEETFSKMLAEQELAYKVTFPRSYRNKSWIF
jgi:DNA-directed RNA polymerase subunit RPC12/RpoP